MILFSLLRDFQIIFTYQWCIQNLLDSLRKCFPHTIHSRYFGCLTLAQHLMSWVWVPCKALLALFHCCPSRFQRVHCKANCPCITSICRPKGKNFVLSKWSHFWAQLSQNINNYRHFFLKTILLNLRIAEHFLKLFLFHSDQHVRAHSFQHFRNANKNNIHTISFVFTGYL